MKDRYYTVQRKLIKARPHIPGEYQQERQALIQQYAFDKRKEAERKEALIALFNRTKEQVEQEEALFVEARRIELNEPRLAREREALLNALQLEQAQQAPPAPLTPTTASGSNVAAITNNVVGAVNGNATNVSAGGSLSTPGGIGIAGGTASTAGLDNKKKKRMEEPGTGPAAVAAGSSSNNNSNSGGNKKNRRISNASSGILEGIISVQFETSIFCFYLLFIKPGLNFFCLVIIDVVPERKEKMVQGVYVRSQKLPVVTKQALQQKLLKSMADLDIRKFSLS